MYFSEQHTCSNFRHNYKGLTRTPNLCTLHVLRQRLCSSSSTSDGGSQIGFINCGIFVQRWGSLVCALFLVYWMCYYGFIGVCSSLSRLYNNQLYLVEQRPEFYFVIQKNNKQQHVTHFYLVLLELMMLRRQWWSQHRRKTWTTSNASQWPTNFYTCQRLMVMKIAAVQPRWPTDLLWNCFCRCTVAERELNRGGKMMGLYTTKEPTSTRVFLTAWRWVIAPLR